MIKKDILEINELNSKFYALHADSFDRSREFYWEGFNDALEFIGNNSKILDLGCGNARFFKFLKENEVNVNYLGVDNNPNFIEKNKENYPKAKFKNLDVITSLNQIQDTFDVIVVFGVTHHIPSKEYRKMWFEQAIKLVEKGGYIVISFWNFDIKKEDKSFKTEFYNKEVSDYFLGWKRDFSEHRYCHRYSEAEIDEIKKLFENFELIKDFNKEDNRYLIFHRLN